MSGKRKFNYMGKGTKIKLHAGKPNRLIAEKSPYLLQHAHNPVDWYPWGEEALAKAKNDGKPILLSIGYSTCHWCHRLAEESFENEKTASFINKNFIPVKVDREERPEIDAYYMSAVRAMTGGGGWPLTVFLTPDLKPFYGGTYFPPVPSYGIPSFTQVLEFVSNLWKEKRGEVTANSDEVVKTMLTRSKTEPADLQKGVLGEGFSVLVASFDPEHGGFGGAPKFPLPIAWSFLLRYYNRTGDDMALKSVTKTLDEMLAGGIRDHVGGGFHRYSTDRVWLVPHFEKMLYDNALLAKLYAEAYQVTKKEEYARVARETLWWMTSEMRDGKGGFYSAQDADTPEGEGKYYTWTPEEVAEVVGTEEGAIVDRHFGITKTGNFEGRSILHLNLASAPPPEEKEIIAKSRLALYRARLHRSRPATDTKVLTSWNGLAISALSLSSTVLGETKLAQAAAEAADFVLKTNSKDGRLLRRYAGGEADFEGTLEDYAFFVEGLLDLFEATSEPRWLKEAIRLTRVMVDDFEDKERGGFYLSIGAVPARLKEGYDGPTPSGNSVAVLNLLRLSELTGDGEFRKTAERTLGFFSGEVADRPTAHSCFLTGLDLLLNGSREIVISSPTLEKAAYMKREVFKRFMPDRALVVVTKESYPELSEMSTLLEGRKPVARARAFVCRNFTCKLPANSAKELGEQLTSR